jgi:glycosyltransferase involved in cell wall biosynthesis
VNKNNAAGLEKTVQSVVVQTFTDFEYIIIDGGSNDGSVDIIKKYADKIIYWVSEPDAGIYNGMNKGIRAAHGEFCLFLNSGDWLIEGATLQNVFKEIARLPEAGEAGVYYSDLVKDDYSMIVYPKNLNINNLIDGTVSHQNSLIRRGLFLKYGYYNESLGITSDWEYFLKGYWIHNIKFIHIDTNIAIFDQNGISISNYQKRLIEDETVIRNVFGELSDSILELKRYRNTSYIDIITNWGDSFLLEFMLKTYRFLARRLLKLKRQSANRIVADRTLWQSSKNVKGCCNV